MVEVIVEARETEKVYYARYFGVPERPEDVLVLLPHCIQSSTCKQELAEGLSNCLGCGGCKVGELSNVLASTGVKAAVVRGGTSARQVVQSTRPKIILAVACERELESGIKDVGSIPVVGIINDRPFGPCKNTSVDVDIFKKSLEMICKQ